MRSPSVHAWRGDLILLCCLFGVSLNLLLIFFFPSFLIFFGDKKLGCLQKGTRVAHVLNFFVFFWVVYTPMQAVLEDCGWHSRPFCVGKRRIRVIPRDIGRGR